MEVDPLISWKPDRYGRTWTHPEGRGVLLILIEREKFEHETLLGLRDLANLTRTIEYAAIFGRWAKIHLRYANPSKSLEQQIEKAEAKACLLIGNHLARTFGRQAFPSAKIENDQGFMGLLSSVNGVRTIATWPLRVYSVPIEQTVQRKEASLLGHLYRHLELLRCGHRSKINQGPVVTKIIQTRKRLDLFLDQLFEASEVSIDTETHNLLRIHNTVITLQVSFDDTVSWILPICHPESTLPPEDLQYAIQQLKLYLEKGRQAIHIYANAAFDLHQLFSITKARWYNHMVYDVQSAEFCLDEQRMFRKALHIDQYTLERIAQEYGLFHYDKSPILKSERKRMKEFDLQKVADYGAIDTALLFRIRKEQLAIAKARNEVLEDRPYRTFQRTIINILGIQTLQFVEMERNGQLFDQKFSAKSTAPDSVFSTVIEKQTKSLMSSKEVVEANRRLLLKQKRGTNTLFANQKAWLFSLRDQKHREMLFFDVCKLEPVSYTKTGKRQMNKKFFEKYRHENEIVEAYQELNVVKTVQVTFMTGLLYKLNYGDDARDHQDGNFRTSFRSLNVITGRASSSPNLQNIPTRNKKLAAEIKRQFIVQSGYLILKRDFSAHEIRGWGAVAKDQTLASTFWIGMITRLHYASLSKMPKDEEATEWATKLRAADVHRQNYQLLYKVRADKVNETQRDSVKAPIFGKVYGLGDGSLGINFQTTALTGAEKERREAEKALAQAEKDRVNDLSPLIKAVKAAKAKIAEIEATDWKAVAKKVSKLIFDDTFITGGRWLKTTYQQGRETLRVRSPVGRVRHLYGHLHVDPGVQAAMDRRGPNSNIQGFGSDMGFVGAYLTRKMLWEWFIKRGAAIDYLQKNAVHDATESSTQIVNIPLMEYLQHHGFTTLVHRFLRDEFGFDLPVGFEMDTEIGGAMSALVKAPTFASLPGAVDKGLQWGIDNLGWKIDKEEELAALSHNNRIIQQIRRLEIERQLRTMTKTNTYMYMTKKNCLELGLVFSIEEWRKLPKSKRNTVLDLPEISDEKMARLAKRAREIAVDEAKKLQREARSSLEE